MSKATTPETASYPVSELNRVKRKPDRGFYDHATVHALLDAAMLCHVSYVIDGQPFCTPTLFWREGSRLYWHGSSANRMLHNLGHGESACLTVTHLDALVLSRSGVKHSADYRSVMAFGKARLVDDPEEKQRALVLMVDRLYPQRTAGLRPTTALEIKATSVIAMDIEHASAKIRALGVLDEDEDYALPVYAERIPVSTVLGQPEPCPRLMEGVQRPGTLEGYSAGRPLQDVLSESYVTTFGKS